MSRQVYLDLAAGGLRVPIGTDLVLREHADHEAILLDGGRLGAVIEEAARRYRTPLAIHLMDLMVEKSAMLQALDVPAEQIEAFQFAEATSLETIDRLRQRLRGPPTARMQANTAAIAHIAHNTSLIPCGMSIGPFSLMTRLLADPITPVFAAGAGATADDDPEVLAVERVLEMSLLVIEQSIQAQIASGAKAILLAEPAANIAFISPTQLAKGADNFERYVMAPNRRIRRILDQSGVDLIFHCCGELIDDMVRAFTTLGPAILSLGSSRRLWEDARIVPKDVVLYGNLPSKRFYSDELVSVAQVEKSADDLIQRMREVGHPFILGSECDVLSVPGSEQTIRAKVAAMMDSRRP
jgi:uroporphyrinogen-III decarboxylase